MPPSRRRAIVAVSVALLALYLLTRLLFDSDYYEYQTADGGHIEFEMPFKGRHFNVVQASFADYRDKRGDPTIVLYRTAKPDYSNPWDWYDIATHPRWRLPYMDPSPLPPPPRTVAATGP